MNGTQGYNLPVGASDVIILRHRLSLLSFSYKFQLNEHSRHNEYLFHRWPRRYAAVLVHWIDCSLYLHRVGKPFEIILLFPCFFGVAIKEVILRSACTYMYCLKQFFDIGVHTRAGGACPRILASLWVRYTFHTPTCMDNRFCFLHRFFVEYMFKFKSHAVYMNFKSNFWYSFAFSIRLTVLWKLFSKVLNYLDEVENKNCSSHHATFVLTTHLSWPKRSPQF